MSTRVPMACVALLLLAATPVSARQESASAARPPQATFRSGVELLRLPVAVVDSEGQPVRDLRASDFSVRIDGKDRRPVFARFLGPNAGTAATPSTASPLSYADNTASDVGRAVVFVVDLLSIKQGYEGPILQTAGKLADGLGRNDAAGLMPVPGKGVDLTRDHGRVSEGLKGLHGIERVPFTTHYFTIREATAFEQLDRRIISEVVERECCPSCTTCPRELRDETKELLLHARYHVQSVLGSMTALATALQQVEGPKTVVLISAGLPFEPESLGRFTELQRAMARSGSVIYAVQVSQPDNDASNLRRPGVGLYQTADITTGLANVATMAGGAMFAGVGTASGVFERLRTEIVNTYELGVEGAASDADGEHDVKIIVSRPGVTVRARPKLFLPPADADAGKRVARLLGQPVELSELPLTLTAYSVRGDESATVKVIVSAELARGTTTAPPVRYGLLALKDSKVAFQAQDIAGKDGNDTKVVTAAQLAPGRYRLRLAALDSAGRTGTVELPITVGLRVAGPLQFSDLIIGVSDQAFAPVVHTRAGQPLDTLVELYSADPGVFGGVTVTCEVRKGGNPAVVASAVSALKQTERERRQLAQGQVATTGWLPGEYTVSAVISVNGTPAGRVSRSIVVE